MWIIKNTNSNIYHKTIGNAPTVWCSCTSKAITEAMWLGSITDCIKSFFKTYLPLWLMKNWALRIKKYIQFSLKFVRQKAGRQVSENLISREPKFCFTFTIFGAQKLASLVTKFTRKLNRMVNNEAEVTNLTFVNTGICLVTCWCPTEETA